MGLLACLANIALILYVSWELCYTRILYQTLTIINICPARKLIKISYIYMYVIRNNKIHTFYITDLI